MKSSKHNLKAVDRVEILTVVDNYVDLLLPEATGVKRAPVGMKGKIPRSTLTAEHGLSLLVKVYRSDVSHSILLDTGYNSSTLLRNMKHLKVDPATIEAVVLSHGHMDHTGGLSRFLERSPGRVTLVAHPDVFRTRFLLRPQEGKLNFPAPIGRRELKKSDVQLVEAIGPVYLADNMILVSGEIPHTTSFEKGMPGAYMEEDGEARPDSIKDDQALILRLGGHGLVVISGCAHSGIINSILYSIELSGETRIAAVIGGFHLSGSDMEPVVNDTLKRLKEFSPGLIMPMHCTGWDTILRLKIEFPESFVMSSVGTRLVLPREA